MAIHTSNDCVAFNNRSGLVDLYDHFVVIMTPTKISITLFVGLCIAAVGTASNILYFTNSGGTPLGPRYSIAMFVVIISIIYVAIHLGKHGQITSIPLITWLSAGFWPIGLLVMQVISLFRSFVSVDRLATQSLFFLIMIFLLMVVFGYTSRYFHMIKHRDNYWHYLALSVIVLCIVSLILKMIGFSGDVPDIHQSVSLAMFGIDAKRASMPFFTGINGSGVMFGAAFFCSAIFAKKSGFSWRALIFAFIAVSMFIGLLWVDTRGSLLALLAVFLFTLTKSRAQVVKILFFITLIGLTLILFDTNFTAIFARSGEGLTTSRNIIWGMSLAELMQPKMIHLIGYGAWGQYVSGLSAGFYNVFSEDLFQVASLHNAVLQTQFDSGYIGVVFYITCWFVLIKGLWREHRQDPTKSTALRLGLAIYIVTSGFFEALIGYSAVSSMFLYVGLLIGFISDAAHRKRDISAAMIQRQPKKFSSVNGEVFNVRHQ